MTMEEAIKILKEKYEQGKDNPQITNPVEWALFRTWQIEHKKRKSRG